MRIIIWIALIMAIVQPCFAKEVSRLTVSVGRSDMTDSDRVELFLMGYDALRKDRWSVIGIGSIRHDIIVSAVDCRIVINFHAPQSEYSIHRIKNNVLKEMRELMERRMNDKMSEIAKKVEMAKSALLKESDSHRRAILEVYLDALIPPTDRTPRPPDPIQIAVE